MTTQILLVDLLIVLAAIFGWRGARQLASGLRRAAADDVDDDAPLTLARGARGLVICLGCIFIAAGVWFENQPLTLFGVVFLAEEIYETSMAVGILRWDQKRRHAEAADEAKPEA